MLEKQNYRFIQKGQQNSGNERKRTNIEFSSANIPEISFKNWTSQQYPQPDYSDSNCLKIWKERTEFHRRRSQSLKILQTKNDEEVGKQSEIEKQ